MKRFFFSILTLLLVDSSVIAMRKGRRNRRNAKKGPMIIEQQARITEIINNTNLRLDVSCPFTINGGWPKININKCSSLKTGELFDVLKKNQRQISIKPHTRNRIEGLCIPINDQRHLSLRRIKGRGPFSQVINITFGPLSISNPPGPFLLIYRKDNTIEQNFRLSYTSPDIYHELFVPDATYTLAIIQLKNCSPMGLLRRHGGGPNCRYTVPQENFHVILKRNNGPQERDLLVLENQLNKYMLLHKKEEEIKKQIREKTKHEQERRNRELARKLQEQREKKRRENILKKEKQISSILEKHKKRVEQLQSRLNSLNKIDNEPEKTELNSSDTDSDIFYTPKEGSWSSDIDSDDNELFLAAISSKEKSYDTSSMNQVTVQHLNSENKQQKMTIILNKSIPQIFIKNFIWYLQRLSQNKIQLFPANQVNQLAMIINTFMSQYEIQNLIDQTINYCKTTGHEEGWLKNDFGKIEVNQKQQVIHIAQSTKQLQLNVVTTKSTQQHMQTNQQKITKK